MSSANTDSFIPSFTTCITFISFSCLTAPARCSSMILNRSGESEYLWLVFYLRGKVSTSHHQVCNVSCGFFVDSFVLIKFMNFPSVLILMRFLSMNGCWILSSDYWNDRSVFLLYPVDVWWINSFFNVKSDLHTRNKSHLVVVHKSFNTLLDLTC